MWHLKPYSWVVELDFWGLRAHDVVGPLRSFFGNNMSSSPALPSDSTQSIDPKLPKPRVAKAKRAKMPPAKKLNPQKKKQVPQNLATEEAEEFEEKTSIFDMLRSMSIAWLFSMVFHLILLLGLGLFTLGHIGDKGPLFITAGEVSENIDLIDVPLEVTPLDLQDLELNSDPLDDAQDSKLVTEVAPELPSLKTTTLTDFGNLSDASETDYGGTVAGLGESLEGGGKPTLFTSGGPVAETVVYIVDNSISMTGIGPQSPGYGRMETALVELAKSVNSLDKSQQFYIIFFSDAAYGTFHPKTVRNYLRATDSNKKKIGYWLNTVECCYRTDGKEAFEIARALKPELIYILGDGAFTDGSDIELGRNPIKGARVEVLGMNLNGPTALRFKALADAHDGKYRDVGLTEDGQKILDQFGPRKGNLIRGPVWGINLPNTLRGLR